MPTAAHRLERALADKKELESEVRAWKVAFDSTLEAENRRLKDLLAVCRAAISNADIDALGSVDPTPDCPGYPIRDELLDDINKALAPKG